MYIFGEKKPSRYNQEGVPAAALEQRRGSVCFRFGNRANNGAFSVRYFLSAAPCLESISGRTERGGSEQACRSHFL